MGEMISVIMGFHIQLRVNLSADCCFSEQLKRYKNPTKRVGLVQSYSRWDYASKEIFGLYLDTGPPREIVQGGKRLLWK
jgi:hypothetical protein